MADPGHIATLNSPKQRWPNEELCGVQTYDFANSCSDSYDNNAEEAVEVAVGSKFRWIFAASIQDAAATLFFARRAASAMAFLATVLNGIWSTDLILTQAVAPRSIGSDADTTRNRKL
jgi:hypothetical protein